ncbi:hypothetical protein CEXT_36701 [Caerostris extrusa]|uniref:Uncharacterized protein n=1 Tax=Caerostris extrusa TaxID=172846 RepID=A0AAV4WW78_CAEEX|nr:hypothetical protein CEXT_36701 [Caerostris extrusa]
MPVSYPYRHQYTSIGTSLTGIPVSVPVLPAYQYQYMSYQYTSVDNNIVDRADIRSLWMARGLDTAGSHLYYKKENRKIPLWQVR